MVSAPVHELHSRSGVSHGLFPLPDNAGLLGNMWPAMPLPAAAAAPAAGELRHAFLLAGPVVLRQRVLRFRYILLRQQGLLQKWPSLPENFWHPLLHDFLSVGGSCSARQDVDRVSRSQGCRVAQFQGDVNRGFRCRR
jgi:hypothetical protein